MNAGDIVERDPSDKPPEPPRAKTAKPIEKKWIPRRRRVVLDPTAQPAAEKPPVSKNNAGSTVNAQKGPNQSAQEEPLSEPERIHSENIRKIQKMSPEEIEREREEIYKSMNPDVLQSLLRRAEMKESQQKKATDSSKPPSIPKGNPVAVTGTKAPPRGSLAEWDPSSEAPKPDTVKSEPKPKPEISSTESANPQVEDIHPEDDDSHVHFASAPEDLRQFFPDSPVETDKSAWMQPIAPDEEDEYSPELVSVAPSELRFDFRGDLVTPRRSRSIPVTAGLHHHGDAPSAAGYTLPELAHLSRSSHPAQRAMAIQTVGRVLHKSRLRKFARSSELQEGLNALVQQTRIIDTSIEAADDRTRSLTVRTRAIEALWSAKANDSSQEDEKDAQKTNSTDSETVEKQS